MRGVDQFDILSKILGTFFQSEEIDHSYAAFKYCLTPYRSLGHSSGVGVGCGDA